MQLLTSFQLSSLLACFSSDRTYQITEFLGYQRGSGYEVCHSQDAFHFSRHTFLKIMKHGSK